MEKKSIKIILLAIVFSFAINFLINIIFPLPKIKEYSKAIYSSEGDLLTAYLTADDKWRMEVSLDEISLEMIKAIINKEDKYFYYHFGFNPLAIARAFFSNITSGKRVSGASTITMQLARLLEPKERTYFNKLLEVFRAIQLEQKYSKKEILEIYLSLLPFGGNIEGIKSASYLYFNKPPAQLSLSQAVALTVIPNNPNFLRLDLYEKNVTKERDKWLKIFDDKKLFSYQPIKDALEEPLEKARYYIPKKAMHFCNKVSSIKNEAIIKTSLSLHIQNIAENLLTNYVNRMRSRKVSNGAIIVIDNSTSQIKAYCGSADFNDDRNSGQVNGIEAVRSPGSTLKPGLFTLAFDKGILTPKTRMPDIPTDFSGYNPENYDLQFHGFVTAEYALVHSLNIPAVRLLSKVGLKNYIKILARVGLQEIKKDENRLGLSLILGGCGVEMINMARFYSTFARKGKLYKLSYFKNEIDTTGKYIFSEAAAYLTAEILSTLQRPDLPINLLEHSKLPKIAWKTGTSYGKRDAWAIGFNPNYTIAVWLGNFDGKGSPYLSGAEMAVPLLFELFNAIDYNSKKNWFSEPDNIFERNVCEKTGLLPSKFCTETITDRYIENISSNKKCDLQKEIFVSEDETVHYCTDCLGANKYKKKVYSFYPNELVMWFEKNHINYNKPPKHYAKCKTIRNSEKPQIISPIENMEYLLERNTGQKILLEAATAPEVKKIFWYVNDKFFKQSPANQKVFYTPPKPGKFKINCIDENGKGTEINIEVKFY